MSTMASCQKRISILAQTSAMRLCCLEQPIAPSTRGPAWCGCSDHWLHNDDVITAEIHKWNCKREASTFRPLPARVYCTWSMTFIPLWTSSFSQCDWLQSFHSFPNQFIRVTHQINSRVICVNKSQICLLSIRLDTVSNKPKMINHIVKSDVFELRPPQVTLIAQFSVFPATPTHLIPYITSFSTSVHD